MVPPFCSCPPVNILCYQQLPGGDHYDGNDREGQLKENTDHFGRCGRTDRSLHSDFWRQRRGHDSRIGFLKSFGWEVSTSPVASGQVKIPDSSSAVYERYNSLQKSQGYDLSQYAGQTVMRYVYKITNYPGATDPVYATVLVFKDQIIGGDVTNTGSKGVVQGFRFPQTQSQTQTLADAEATA